MNKRRTIVTIIGVILSTALMVGIGLLFSSAREYSIHETIRYNGNYHAKVSNIPYEKQSLIEHNTNVETTFFEHLKGFAYLVGGQNEYKPYLALYSVSENYFDELKLLSGRFPENENEIVISNHIKKDGEVTLELGSTLSLQIGNRITSNNEMIFENNFLNEEERLDIQEDKTYKIVGIVERSVYEDYSGCGYSIFTIQNSYEKEDMINSYVIYKTTKNVYKKVDQMAAILGKEGNLYNGNLYYDEIDTNDALLSILGSSRYGNINSAISRTIVIVLSVISIGCIIVIYNSFAISVMERKKQFGLFSSIGATKKQLRQTVFFEAFLIGIIGIPLGILSAFIGIGTVLAILNELLKGIFEFPFTLSVYPSFVIIPLLFMVIVITLSAILPARRASRITPIEAIRLNDDIKMKKKSVKTPKWIRKIFGVEGELALKNMKRNKKKYRITIASLFISIVMFISFSSFLQYGLIGANDLANIPDHNIEIYLEDSNLNLQKQYVNEFLNYENVKQKSAISFTDIEVESFPLSYYTKSTLKYFQNTLETYHKLSYTHLLVMKLDSENYQSLIKANGYHNGDSLFINRLKGTDYSSEKRVSYDIQFMNTIPQNLELCNVQYDYEAEYDTNTGYFPILSKNCDVKVENIKEIKEYPFGLDGKMDGIMYLLIVPEETYDQIIDMKNTKVYSTNLFLKVTNYQKLDQYVKELETSNRLDGITYINIEEEMKMVNNLILAIEILLYGFIALVTLIGVTSVFNTISTSIALRRKEFAMLRSMGLTPGGFNRMICFESLFFGLKSLFYGLPFSFLIILLLASSVDSMIDFGTILIPYQSIFLAILGVFVIVFLSMVYSTRKIKKENILEAIREENI